MRCVNHRPWVFLLVCALCGAALLGVGCSSEGSGGSAVSVDRADLQKPGQLTILADFDSSLIEGSAEDPTGFEAELMEAVCQQLGLESVWVAAEDRGQMLPALVEGKTADVAISGFSISDVEGVSFSDSYLDLDVGLYTLDTHEIGSIQELPDKHWVVGVMSGSFCEDWMAQNQAEVAVAHFSSFKALFSALRSNAIDAVLVETAVGNAHAGTIVDDNYDGLDIPFEGTTVQLAQSLDAKVAYGIALPEGNDALLRALDQALNNVKRSGVYDGIYESYFSQETNEGAVEDADAGESDGDAADDDWSDEADPQDGSSGDETYGEDDQEDQ